MAAGMKKTHLLIAGSALAVVIAGLLVGLAACQMGMEESLPLPLALPVGRISPGSGADSEFTLDWERPDVVLRADGNYVQDTVGALKALVIKWKEYEKLVGPLMYIDGSVPRSYAVFDASGSLNNASSLLLILQRYWPADAEPLTGASWTAALDKRKAAFLTTKGNIKGLMNELKKSAFWETESDELDSNGKPVKPLQQVYGLMETFIHDPGDYTDLGDLHTDGALPTMVVALDTADSVALYELYFDYIPKNIKYSDQYGEKPYDNP